MFSNNTVSEGQNPAGRSPHLGVGHIHASGIQPVLYLLCIVDLQEVITTKLHICQLLVVLKEVDGEGHLAGRARCCGEQHQIAGEHRGARPLPPPTHSQRSPHSRAFSTDPGPQCWHQHDAYIWGDGRRSSPIQPQYRPAGQRPLALVWVLLITQHSSSHSWFV